jgi:hypothetical protein
MPILTFFAHFRPKSADFRSRNANFRLPGAHWSYHIPFAKSLNPSQAELQLKTALLHAYLDVFCPFPAEISWLPVQKCQFPVPWRLLVISYTKRRVSKPITSQVTAQRSSYWLNQLTLPPKIRPARKFRRVLGYKTGGLYPLIRGLKNQPLTVCRYREAEIIMGPLISNTNISHRT